MKYKVIRKFLGGPELGTILEDDKSGQVGSWTTFHTYSLMEVQFLLDSGYIEEVHGNWRPEEGDKFWSLSGAGDVDWYTYNDDRWSNGRVAFNNAFKTEAEAVKARDAIKELLKTI